jgi:hypothetical protein
MREAKLALGPEDFAGPVEEGFLSKSPVRKASLGMARVLEWFFMALIIFYGYRMWGKQHWHYPAIGHDQVLFFLAWAGLMTLWIFKPRKGR